MEKGDARRRGSDSGQCTCSRSRKETRDGEEERAGNAPVSRRQSSSQLERETPDGGKEGAGNTPVAGVVSSGKERWAMERKREQAMHQWLAEDK